jgi:hypothetical protein
MRADQVITIYYPEDYSESSDHETTWAEFVNDNDPETVAEIERQLNETRYAKIGGGAAPLVWIFA